MLKDAVNMFYNTAPQFLEEFFKLMPCSQRIKLAANIAMPVIVIDDIQTQIGPVTGYLNQPARTLCGTLVEVYNTGMINVLYLLPYSALNALEKGVLILFICTLLDVFHSIWSFIKITIRNISSHS
jgi:hypothetical protein